MRSILCAAVMIGTVLAAPTLARADDDADMKALIDKAIKAHGGADKLSKHKATTTKFKGKYYGMGEGIDYTGEWNIQPPEKFRVQINFEINAMKITFIMVFDVLVMRAARGARPNRPAYPPVKRRRELRDRRETGPGDRNRRNIPDAVGLWDLQAEVAVSDRDDIQLGQGSLSWPPRPTSSAAHGMI